MLLLRARTASSCVQGALLRRAPSIIPSQTKTSNGNLGEQPKHSCFPALSPPSLPMLALQAL